MHWKHVLMVAGAALATMYAIRYLRASNTLIASLYPAPATVAPSIVASA